MKKKQITQHKEKQTATAAVLTDDPKKKLIDSLYGQCDDLPYSLNEMNKLKELKLRTILVTYAARRQFKNII